jgi:arylsulfatase A-like enzyme
VQTISRRTLLSSAAALTGALSSRELLAAGSRPNIILCMGDDHGWNETGYNGHPFVRTPVLDDMAASGLRFDRLYSAAPVCSPTRGSIMTGRHPNRYGAFAPNYSIRPEEITLPQLLKQAGYACGHFGKWHLGPVKAGSPTNPGAMGFDEWLSHDNFFEMNPPLVRNGAAPQTFQGESSEIVVREATRYISKVKQRPFFTVIWFGSPHAPYSGVDTDLALYGKAPKDLQARFAEITALDRAMGQLRAYLKSERLNGNTLLWYCGDNGTPADARLNMAFRGNKGSVWEGGLRVPGIIEWPARIKPRITNVNAVTSDMLPTLCDLVGQPLPKRPIDGISLAPLLEDRMKERPAPICFWQYNTRQEAKESPGPYIDGALQRGTTPTAKVETVVFNNYRHARAKTTDFGGSAAILGNRHKLVVPPDGTAQLYDVQADPGESNDVVAKNADLAANMHKTLETWQRSVEVSLTGADYRK